MTEKRAVTFNADPAIEAMIDGMDYLCLAVVLLVPAMTNEQLKGTRDMMEDLRIDLESQMHKRGVPVEAK